MGRSTSYKDLELRQLRTFSLAATHGNFTVAARTLGLSVPTVWEQVRALERKLGSTLLLRRGHVLELTAEGRLLLELIQPHVSGLDSLERLFRSRRKGLPLHLGVAGTQYLMGNLLPGPVEEFTAKYPDSRVRLYADPEPRVVMPQLENGQADVGLVPSA